MKPTQGQLEQFWDNWVERFNEHTERYVRVNNEYVLNEVSKLDINDSDTTFDKARKAWLHVYKNYSYRLSRDWKTPPETINDGEGDCEDFTFLLASMFPNVGITESFIIVGNLYYGDGTMELHTWNEVAGQTIDGTGPPDVVRQLRYDEVKRWKVIDINDSRKNQTGTEPKTPNGSRS